MRRTWIWVLVIAVILILAAVVFGSMGKNPEALNNTEDDSAAESATYLVSDNAINVDEQKAGSTATISFAALKDSGFVVIHESNNGVPGKVIGSSALLPPGQSNNVPISLSSPLVAGKKYIAMLHLDDGNGVLSETDDAPAKDKDGNVVMMEFEASGGSAGAGVNVNL